MSSKHWDHPVDEVRLKDRASLGVPPHEFLMGRPSVSRSGSGWKRPEAEYQRPSRALELVSFVEARQTEPGYVDFDTRPAFWSSVQGVSYHRAAMVPVKPGRWAWFELVPELHNPHDRHAVAIDLDGVRIGYVGANIAYRLHWRIRYLNGDGRACYVPGAILSKSSVYVVLPTQRRLDKLVDRDVVASEVKALWQALPPAVRADIVDHNFSATVDSMKWILGLKDLCPHLGLPRVTDPDLMPQAWNEFLRDMRTRAVQERIEKRDAQIFDLQAQGRTKADIARRLGVSATTVSKVLARGRASTHGPPASAERSQSDEQHSREPFARESVRRTPLTKEGGAVGTSEQPGSEPSESRGAEPGPIQQAADLGMDGQTQEVEAALDIWRKGLLTVSGASRLINYRPTKSRSLSIESPTADDILRRLEAGNPWSFVGRRPPANEGNAEVADGEDAALDDEPAFAYGSALRSTRAQTELGPVLRTMMRLANTEWLDRGIHTLYLAFGMLHWKDVDNTEYASPLVLVPVELIPLGPRDIPRLGAAEDDALLNPALRVQLERMGVALPDGESLEGLAIERQLAMISDAVGDRGWRVADDVVLSLFTFHKEAMYRDLIENHQAILAHPIVRALGTSDPLKQSRAFDFEPIRPEDIDRLAPPEDTPMVLDADSSQRAAIAAAVAGHSFVMDGPPGTGKSQTIANMIGALLHAGKTVLFVSEKAAALEVVRNRLEHAGLLDYLFELHSSKTSRREVAAELMRALETRPIAPTAMSGQDQRAAASLRERLSGYAAAMNETRHPLNKSLHDVLGRVAMLVDAPHVPYPANAAPDLSEEGFWEVQNLLSSLHQCWRPAEQGSSFLWHAVVDPSPFEDRVLAVRRSLEELRGAVDGNRELAASFSATAPTDANRLARLIELQTEARPDGVMDHWLTTESWRALEEELVTLQTHLAAVHEAEVDWVKAAGVEWDSAPTIETFVSSQSADSGRTPFASGAHTASHCLAAAHQLDECAEALARGLGGVRRLAAVLGLPPVVTVGDVDRVLDLADLCGAPHKPSHEWFGRGTRDLRLTIRSLHETVAQLTQAEADARPYFTDAALHAPVAELLERFRTQHKGLNKLAAGYRADKRQLAQLLASDVKVADGIRGLEKAVSWAKAHFQYQQLAEVDGATLGGYWLGRGTPFEAAMQAVAVVDRVHHALAGLSLNDRLLANLTSAQGSHLAGVAAGVRRDLLPWHQAFQPGGVLQQHHALLLEPLENMALWIRERARMAEADAAAISTVDAALGRQHTLHEAARVATLWSRVAAARGEIEVQRERNAHLFGPLFRGLGTDLGSLTAAVDWARTVREFARGALTTGQVEALTATRANHRIIPCKERWDAAVTAFVEAFSPDRRAELLAELDDFESADSLLADLLDDPAGQMEWFRYRALRARLAELGLDDCVRACIELRIPKEDVPRALEKSLLRSWANEVISTDSRLAPASADEREALVEQYRQLDTELIHSAHGRIIKAVNTRRPHLLGMGEQGVIQREGMKKKRHIPVRDLIAKTKATAMSLKPCFMMSPLAVSQYLPPDIRFDVVIFDEASQITPSDAVNCIYRGHALILAGDDKQLPPTSFFEKMDEGDLEQEETDVKDFESVLELAKASGALRNLALRWHYRSADDALINYSNYKFYDGKLVVFPGPGSEEGERAITFHQIDGVYRRGATRDNPIEAAAVAARVLEHFSTTPHQTLGVVTFSVAQASAVQDAIDRAREGRRELDAYFDVNERLDAFFVKSLESVQGDERDKIIFSVGYGPDENGKITTNFGVLNRDKGWRRLNVAITRARQRIEVLSSISAGDLPPSANENVEYLRAYLDYAKRGFPALAVNLGTTGASPESPFEESVIGVLAQWGYDIEPQVGSAGYRIDIGVRHPDYPGLYLLGVECDGYQYHSAPAARDRDRLREQVLRRLGWRLHRIWGTAWERDRKGEEERLRAALTEALSGNGQASASPRRGAVTVGYEIVEQLDRPAWATDYLEARVPALPYWVDVSDPGAGFDMADAVRKAIELEGPIHIDILHQRLREAWGIGRIGSKIRQNIDTAIKHSGAQRQADFLLMPTTRTRQVRTPSAITLRKVEHIHPEELGEAMVLLLREMGSATTEQLLVATARLFGWGRTGYSITGRLEPIIDDLVHSQRIGRDNGLLVSRQS